MMYQDPRIDPRTANIIDHDVDQTFTRRSLRAIAGIALGLFFMGWLAAWFVTGDRTVEDNDNTALKQTAPKMSALEPAANSNPAADSGSNAFSDLTSGMLESVKQALGSVQSGLPNTGSNNELNTGPGNPQTILKLEEASKKAAANINAQRSPAAGREYAYTIENVIGSRVVDKNGQESGKIYDVLVNKDTGEAKAIVVQDDRSYYQRDLKAIGFEAVDRKRDSGDMLLTVTENTVEKAKTFEYTEKVNETYVSLRRLQDGELIDFEDRTAGKIDAVIYENAQAKDIFFTLHPFLSTPDMQQFRLPFDKVEIVETPDGLDVQLSEEQTRALASLLFANNAALPDQDPGTED